MVKRSVIHSIIHSNIVPALIVAGTVVFHSIFSLPPACASHPASLYIAQSPPGESQAPDKQSAGDNENKSQAEAERAALERKNVADKKHGASSDKPAADLPNFHEVHPFLYRSGEPSPAGIKKLHEMGVKTLIDLRAPTERAHNEKKLAEELGMRYINLPMSNKPPTKSQVQTLLSTIDSAREKNEPVLVHCAHGSDRTGCMIGIWRVARDGWGFDDTYKEMRKYYFGPKFTLLKEAVRERAEH